MLLDRSGGGAAEFSLVLPFLILILFGMIDTGRYMWEYNKAEKATMMGARFAVVTNPVDSDLVTTNYVGTGGLTQGDPIPASSFGVVTCTSTSCTCTTSPCPGLTRNGTAVDLAGATLGFCRRLRANEKTRNIPVIMVTARGEESDKLMGLDYGADDYITKPFSPAELVARCRAVLRRVRPAFSDESLIFADINMDLSTHRVTRSGMDVQMGPTEFKLLRHFMENPKRVFNREQLLDSIWGNNIYVELRTVDVHIRRLRKALDVQGGMPDLVRTVRSAGYALEES